MANKKTFFKVNLPKNKISVKKIFKFWAQKIYIIKFIDLTSAKIFETTIVWNNFVTVEKEVSNPFNGQGTYRSQGTSTLFLDNSKF